MSERLPYETQLAGQWSATTAGTDFPLPDENLAWADMRLRLDEDEEKRPVAWWRWGCLGWALLGLLAVGAGWYFLQPQKWFSENRKNETVISEQPPPTGPAKQQEKRKQPIAGSTTGEQQTGTYSVNEKAAQGKQEIQIENDKPTVPSPVLKPLIKETGQSTFQSGNGKKQKKITVNQKNSSTTNAKARKEAIKNKPKMMNQAVGQTMDTTEKKDDPLPKRPVSLAVVKNDTVQVKQKDTLAVQKSVPRKDSVNVKTGKEKKEQEVKDKIPLVFSAGFGLHQQIPLAGQTFTPYSSQGRKVSFADYLPAVYLRLEKEKKWFLQGEFRYGAPQYTKQFTYRQQLVPDTGSNPRYSTLTAYGLKKTFYHQLPLTFHYFIRPGWSVGAGMQWNLFNSAVAEKEVNRKNNFTQIDSLVSRSIFRETNSGNIFRKTYLQAVIESQYKRNRFSFGARYAFGLQPYIRFSLPGQPISEERNHALQIFIRYELWRQKNE